jgi:hypothetical protein
MLIDVEPAPVTDGGVNVAVAPAGSPVTLKSTVPVKPDAGVTVAVYVVPWPATTVCDDGVAATLKFDTVMVRVTGWLVRPPLSVTVSEAT